VFEDCGEKGTCHLQATYFYKNIFIANAITLRPGVNFIYIKKTAFSASLLKQI
jgi:hypothetical protein